MKKLSLWVLAAAWLLPASAVAQLPELELEVVATDLDRVTGLTHAGDSRLFVVSQTGRVFILEDGELQAEPFLDIVDRVSDAHNAEGLLGLAFHPDVRDNGFFFVTYVSNERLWTLARYRLGDDPRQVDPSTEEILLQVSKYEGFHFGGQLQFGPDGYLYVSLGDSGTQFDPLCVAQKEDSLEGKILRLDVDQNVDQVPYYGIPEDNPFAGSATARPEIWALGLRNPWRFAFDRATGDLFIGDVGLVTREEVNLQPAGSPGGVNYGWKRLEGTLCQSEERNCVQLPPCDSELYTPPIFEYEHGPGRCAVIAGYMYRGLEIPELDGHFIYGDFCSGALFAARRDGDVWQSEDLPFVVGNQLITFGEDVDGEIYVATRPTIWKLVAPETPPPTCVSDATHLCLQGERFRADVSWTNQAGQTGTGRAIPLSEDSGFFWFFEEDNPEVFVKVLDACTEPFLHFWVFAAGLTDVETRLTVVDTETGATRRYDKPLGVGFDPVRDTTAFDTCPDE